MYSIRVLSTNEVSDVTEIDNKSFSKGWRKEQFKEMIDSESHLAVGVFESTQCIGYALFSFVLDEADLLRVAVSGKLRNNGIGGRLLANSLMMLNKNGINRVFLEVRADNFSARRVYERCGFLAIDTRKKYYGDCDAIVYRWENTNGCNHIGY